MTKSAATQNDTATVGAQFIAPEASPEHGQKGGVSGWRECKLGDILHFGNGKTRPKHDGDIPVYGGNGVLGYANQSNYEGETIVIGRVGAYCGAVYYENRPIWVSDNALSAFPKSGYDTKYLYYFLKNMDLNSHAGGSSHPLVTQTLLNSLDVDICIEPSEQKAIAAVLSSLDDKIDLLHRQNQTLEAMAQTLFRQWFTEEAKEDWEDGYFGDAVVILDEQRVPLSKMQRDKKKEGVLYPYYGAAQIMDYVNDYLFDGEYILLGEDGTVRTDDGFPVLQYATGKFWVNNHAHVLRAKPPYSNYFIWNYLLKKNIDEIITGAVQPKINQGNLKKLDFPKYPVEMVEKFNTLANRMLEKINQNQQQIQTLNQLRDTLLPKLMSGEIRVEVEYE